MVSVQRLMKKISSNRIHETADKGLKRTDKTLLIYGKNPKKGIEK
jgi:hypothetical protein